MLYLAPKGRGIFKFNFCHLKVTRSHAKIVQSFSNYFLKTQAKIKGSKVLKWSCFGLHKNKSDLERQNQSQRPCDTSKSTLSCKLMQAESMYVYICSAQPRLGSLQSVNKSLQIRLVILLVLGKNIRLCKKILKCVCAHTVKHLASFCGKTWHTAQNTLVKLQMQILENYRRQKLLQTTKIICQIKGVVCMDLLNVINLNGI